VNCECPSLDPELCGDETGHDKCPCPCHVEMSDFSEPNDVEEEALFDSLVREIRETEFVGIRGEKLGIFESHRDRCWFWYGAFPRPRLNGAACATCRMKLSRGKEESN